jgi:hypothetical protein
MFYGKRSKDGARHCARGCANFLPQKLDMRYNYIAISATEMTQRVNRTARLRYLQYVPASVRIAPANNVTSIPTPTKFAPAALQASI